LRQGVKPALFGGEIATTLQWYPFLTLGIRLQFAFAARMSEIISMEWDWIDFVNRRVVWPDSEVAGFVWTGIGVG
jgi:integrase